MYTSYTGQCFTKVILNIFELQKAGQVINIKNIYICEKGKKLQINKEAWISL